MAQRMKVFSPTILRLNEHMVQVMLAFKYIPE